MHRINATTTLILVTFVLFTPGWSLPYGERPSSGRRSYGVAKLFRGRGERQRSTVPHTDSYLDCASGMLEQRRCPTGCFFDADIKRCTPARPWNPGSSQKSFRPPSSPFLQSRRGTSASSPDGSRPSIEKQERRQPHSQLNSADKEREGSASMPPDKRHFAHGVSSKEQRQDSIASRREKGLSTERPNEQRRGRPWRCPDRAVKQSTKQAAITKGKPATRALNSRWNTESPAPISKTSYAYTASAKATDRRRISIPMSPSGATGSTLLKKTLSLPSASSGITEAMLLRRKAVTHATRSTSTPANFKSTRKKGCSSSSAMTSKAPVRKMTSTPRPVKWTSRQASSTHTGESVRTRDPHRTEADQKQSYIHLSTTESHRQETKSHTGESSKAVTSFPADLVTSISPGGNPSATPERHRTVNMTSGNSVHGVTLASTAEQQESEKTKDVFSTPTAATLRPTKNAHGSPQHEGDVQDSTTTVVPRRSPWSTAESGETVLAVTSKNADRAEALDTITQGTSTRDSYRPETALEAKHTESLESGTPVPDFIPPNSMEVNASNAKSSDIPSNTDSIPRGTNVTIAGLKVLTTNVLSESAGLVSSEGRTSATAASAKRYHLASTTPLPATEVLPPSSPSPVTLAHFTEALRKGTAEAPARMLTTVAVTKETIVHDGGQLPETGVNLPLLTVSMPTTTMHTTAMKISETDSVFLNTPAEGPTAWTTEFTHATTASRTNIRVSTPDDSYLKTAHNEERDLLFPSAGSEVRVTTSKSQATETSVSFETLTETLLPPTSDIQSAYYPDFTFLLTETPAYSREDEEITTRIAPGIPSKIDVKEETILSNHQQSTSVNDALTRMKEAIKTTSAPTIINAPTSSPQLANQCRQQDCALTTEVGAASPITPERTQPKNTSVTTLPPGTKEVGKQLAEELGTAKKLEAEERIPEFEENSALLSRPSSTEDDKIYPPSIVPTEFSTSFATSTEQNLDATGVTEMPPQENSKIAITLLTATEVFWNKTGLTAPHNTKHTVMPTFTGAPLPSTVVQKVAARRNLTSAIPSGGPGSTKVPSVNNAADVSIARNSSKHPELDGTPHKSTLAVFATRRGVFKSPIKTKEPAESESQMTTLPMLPTTDEERQAVPTADLGVTAALTSSTDFPSTVTDSAYTEGPRMNSSEYPSSTALSSLEDSWKTLTPSGTPLKDAEEAVLSSSTRSLQYEKDRLSRPNVEAEKLDTTEDGLIAMVTSAGFPIYQSPSSTSRLAETVPYSQKPTAPALSNPTPNTEIPFAISAGQTTDHFRTSEITVESESSFSKQKQKKETTPTVERAVSDSEVVTTGKAYQNNVEESSERLTEELHLSKSIWRTKNVKPSMTMYLTTHFPRMPNSNTPRTSDYAGNYASELNAGTPTKPADGEEYTSEMDEINLPPSGFPLQGFTATEVPSPLGTVSYTDGSASHEELSTTNSPQYGLTRATGEVKISLPGLESDDETMLQKGMPHTSVPETSTVPWLTSGRSAYMSSTEPISYEPSTLDETVRTTTEDGRESISTGTMATPSEQYADSRSPVVTSSVISTPKPSMPTTHTTTTSRAAAKQETTTKAPICKASFGLFRHPTDCNLFVHCSYSKPYVKKCPANLHFNERIMVCDYPYRAGCLISRV